MTTIQTPGWLARARSRQRALALAQGKRVAGSGGLACQRLLAPACLEAVVDQRGLFLSIRDRWQGTQASRQGVPVRLGARSRGPTVSVGRTDPPGTDSPDYVVWLGSHLALLGQQSFARLSYWARFRPRLVDPPHGLFRFRRPEDESYIWTDDQDVVGSWAMPRVDLQPPPGLSLRFSSAVQMEVAFVDHRFGPHEAIWQDEGRGIRGLLLTSAGPGMDRAWFDGVVASMVAPR